MNTQPSLSKKTFLLGCVVGGLSAVLIPLLIERSRAETKLLPFQGRLTDAGGNAIADGAKVVEFKMYDAPTGGSVKWAGEVHKLSVNGGLVNTMLGSKAGLGSVDFSTGTFLQITVDANGDGQITAADPPLLPRQSVSGSIYAVEAGNSRSLGGHPASEYQAIFDGGNPASGQIPGTKIKPGSLPMSVFAPDTITASQIGSGEVGELELAANSVTSPKIRDGAVTIQKLGPIAVGQFDVPPGGIALSATSPPGFVFSNPPVETDVTNLDVTLTVTGRPVEVGLIADPASVFNSSSYIGLSSAPGSAIYGFIRFYRTELNPTNGAAIGTRQPVQLFLYYLDSGTSTTVNTTPTTARCLDFATVSGKKYRYTVTLEGKGNWTSAASDRFGINFAKLMAREL